VAASGIRVKFVRVLSFQHRKAGIGDLTAMTRPPLSFWILVAAGVAFCGWCYWLTSIHPARQDQEWTFRAPQVMPMNALGKVIAIKAPAGYRPP
jgi:hypothetical protein